jgi:RNA polymerase sigma-70 factor (ECF subfamily)
MTNRGLKKGKLHLPLLMFGKQKKKSPLGSNRPRTLRTPLLQYAMSIVGEIERARDIVQETFMRLHNQEQEAIEGHLSQWLFTVCRNCSLKSLKKEGPLHLRRGAGIRAEECESLTPFANSSGRNGPRGSCNW